LKRRWINKEVDKTSPLLHEIQVEERFGYVIIHTGSRLFVICGKNIDGQGIGNGLRLELNLSKIQMA